MHTFKRAISLMLVLCMLLSVLPLSAFALTVTEKPANNTTTGQPFPYGTANSENFRIPGIVTLNDGTLIAISDARWTTNVDAGGLDTIASVSKDNGATWTYTFANYLGDNGNKYNARSSCFIDPAIATDGETAYLIADLFPAGVTTYNVLYAAQPGSTGYNDAGNLLLRSDSEQGLTFGASGYAVSAASASYDYYLKDGKIWKAIDNTEVAGYSVDAYFNITYTDGDNEVKTNLFFEDSPYKPFPTNYLYMTTSTDGLNWSTPTLLNLKEADETAFLVGPGSGIAVDGRMVYTAYEYNGDVPSQRTCLIWRDADGGWHRSGTATDGTLSSEASVVDLGDGKLRVFYRDGNKYLSYTDFNWSEEENNYVRDTSATSVATTAAKRAGTGCMVSSYKYSKQIEGKDVILVSTPAYSEARDNGYLYVFLVDPTDKSMELAYAYDIIPKQNEDFAYSCITETKDGKIALLWESHEIGPCEITFSLIDMNDVTAIENDLRLDFIDVELHEGDTWSGKDNTGNYSVEDAVIDYDKTVVGLTVEGTTVELPAATTMASGNVVALKDCLYTLTGTAAACKLQHTLTDGTTVYIDAHAGAGNTGYPNRTYTSELTLANSENTEGAIVIKDATGSLHLHKEAAAPYWNQCDSVCTDKHDLLFFCPAESGEAESTVFDGFVQVTDVANLKDGGQYLIAAQAVDGNYYVLTPANGGGTKLSNDHLAKFTGLTAVSSSAITIEALAAGSTMVQFGSNVYRITVWPFGYDPYTDIEIDNVYRGSAITVTKKPDNGSTVGQPFLTGTGGSTNFRIPGLVTLDNGNLIATTDARWNHAGDGAGLDTLVSVSEDNGENWKYTFANYLGDNGNSFNNLSTCIIDPAIGTDGTTAYLIADLFPAGIALNTSKYSPVAGENGFDENGNLMLRDLFDDTVIIGQSEYSTMAAAREYNYYLDLETYKVYTINGSECKEFTVDKYFNISYTDSEGTHETNLFFADSPLQPYPTDYLYMTTSKDGLNWSEPKLLNLQSEAEQVLLVGPGNGTYNEAKGHMVFTAYRHTNGASGTAYECTCLIWMDAEGNWHRTEDATVNFWSSEASVVALADGTLRVFYRDAYNVLNYTDFVWSDTEKNYVRDPDATEVSTTAVKDDGCQLSAITYSQKIEDKEAIIVATPANPASRRTDGHMYVFLVNEDKTMELAYDYDIVPDTTEVYAYSCISEMADGSIALLYEGDYAATSGSAEIIFTTIAKDVLTDRDNDARLNFVDVTVLTNESTTVTDSTGDYTSANTDELDTAKATVEMTATSKTTMAGQLGSNANYDGDITSLDNCLYTFTKDDNNNWVIQHGDVYIYNNAKSPRYPHSTESATFTIEASTQEEGSFYIRGTGDSNGAKNYLYFDRSAYNWNRVNAFNPSNANNTIWMTNSSMSLFKPVDGEGSGEITGYERVTSVDDIASEGQYLIGAKGNDGNWYVAYPSTVTTTLYNQIAKVVDGSTTYTTKITFKGLTPGVTEVQIGSTVYRVTVKDYDIVNVNVAVGDSIDIETTSTGDITELDETYVTADVADGNLTITGVYPGSTSFVLDRIRYNVTVTGSVVKVDVTKGESESRVIESADAVKTTPDSNIASVSDGTACGAQLGSAASTYEGKYTALENALYTFKDNGNSTWFVSSTTADGTTVYLEPYATSVGNGYPNVTSSVAVTLSDGSAENSVALYGNDGYLHFYRNGNLYFDRVQDNAKFGAETSFLLYRPVAEGDTSSEEIPGFVQVEGKDNVKEGKYLIVAECDSNYYLLYPSTSTDHRSAQIAHVVSNAPAVVITGNTVGNTSFRVGSTVFEVSVKDVENVEEMFEVTSSNMVLGNELAMNFFVTINGTADENSVAVVTMTYADGREAQVVEIPYGEWVDTGDGRKKIRFDGIAAKEMSDNINVVIKSGEEIISNSYNDSVREYAQRGLALKSTAVDTRTMLVDMLNYGAAAQQVFTYNTDDLANKNIDDYQQYATASVEINNYQEKGNGYKSATLTLENEIYMTMVFYKSVVTSDMTAVVTFTNHENTLQTVEIAGSDFIDRGSAWGIVVDELVVADARQIVTCTFLDADGNEVEGVYGKDSIESFCYRAIEGSGSNYYEYIMKFCSSAYDYFHGSDSVTE